MSSYEPCIQFRAPPGERTDFEFSPFTMWWVVIWVTQVVDSLRLRCSSRTWGTVDDQDLELGIPGTVQFWVIDDDLGGLTE